MDKNFTSNRPDFSEYLVHFTRDGDFCNKEQLEEVSQFRKMTAKQKILSILNTKKIIASQMPWTNTKGVCFTECPWSSLLAHAEIYSPYGIGFKKSTVFDKKGAPVFYLRGNLFKRLKELKHKPAIIQELWKYVTTFSPPYRTEYVKKQERKIGITKSIDYSHEREWRCPSDFKFEISNIEFLVVKSFDDIKEVPTQIKELLGEKIIIMDNYKEIETLWPVHIMHKK